MGPDEGERAVQVLLDELGVETEDASRERAEHRRAENTAARELARRYRDGRKLTEMNRVLMGAFEFRRGYGHGLPRGTRTAGRRGHDLRHARRRPRTLRAGRRRRRAVEGARLPDRRVRLRLGHRTR